MWTLWARYMHSQILSIPHTSLVLAATAAAAAAAATAIAATTAAATTHIATISTKLAAAVDQYPSAIGIELMNEPPFYLRGMMYETWEACTEAIRAQSATIAVGVSDPGNGESPQNGQHRRIPTAATPRPPPPYHRTCPAQQPHHHPPPPHPAALPIGDIDLRSSTVAWLESEPHLFYCFHWYGTPDTPTAAVDNAAKLASKWGMPALLTEFGGYVWRLVRLRHPERGGSGRRRQCVLALLGLLLAQTLP